MESSRPPAGGGPAAGGGRLHRLGHRVWRRPAQPLAPWPARGLRLLRTALILVRDLAEGQLTLRAMSLVYTTLLSIVPLLALSFSVLKAFGVSNLIEPMLLNVLAPLGDMGLEITQRIVSFIRNMNVGVLGAVGLALLLYTAISLVQKIELSLNYIWHVPQPRRLGERFSRYLSVLLVGPLLVFSALGITATVMNVDTVQAVLKFELFGQAVQVLGRLMPYVLVAAAFTFVYVFIPNTRVRLAPALVGGVVGGIGWQTAGWAFAAFVASSNNYAAIYSGFAILILFMIWLYLSWLVLLFGASVAFYAQHPEYLVVSGGEPRLSNRVRERLALSTMNLVAGRFLDGGTMPTHAELSQRLGVPAHALQVVLEALEQNGLLLRSAAESPAYLPARDPSLIAVAEVLATVRAAGEDRFVLQEDLPVAPQVEGVLRQVQQAMDDTLGAMTLRELAAAAAAPAAPPAAPAAGG